MKKIAIDLGTTYTLVHVPKRGIIINEPSVVAISALDKQVLAVGEEARDMLGRTPDTIIARRPLKDGVIADYKTTESMLKYFISKAGTGFRFFRPEVMIAVPAGITSTEKRAVIEATLNGSLNGLEFDNKDDMIEKSTIIEMLKSEGTLLSLNHFITETILPSCFVSA